MTDNELIAEFMGLTYSRKDIQWYDSTGLGHGAYIHYYQTSWDWLMPVMAEAKKKIKSAGWGTPTEKQAWMRLNAALNEVYNINIKNAHYCLVKFIEWYNQTLNHETNNLDNTLL